MDLRDDARNYSDMGLQVQEFLQEARQHVPDSDAGVVGLHPFIDLYGCTSHSGNMKTSSTIPTIVKSRKAVSSPFHTRDCHMRSHSPPTEINATSHIRSDSVSAITGIRLAADDLRARHIPWFPGKVVFIMRTWRTNW
jgi:hypothetical protein